MREEHRREVKACSQRSTRVERGRRWASTDVWWKAGFALAPIAFCRRVGGCGARAFVLLPQWSAVQKGCRKKFRRMMAEANLRLPLWAAACRGSSPPLGGAPALGGGATFCGQAEYITVKTCEDGRGAKRAREQRARGQHADENMPMRLGVVCRTGHDHIGNQVKGMGGGTA